MPSSPNTCRLLCSKCKRLVGNVTGKTFHVHQKDGDKTLVASAPVTGFLQVWCPGCNKLLGLDVAEATKNSPGRKKMPVRLRDIYIEPPVDHA